MQWADAINNVTELNSAGTMSGMDCNDVSNSGSHQTDWHLPNLRELQSLISYEYIMPAMTDINGNAQATNGNPFVNVRNEYWTSTSYMGDSTLA